VTRSSLVFLAIVALAGCESQYPRPLADFDLPPVSDGRRPLLQTYPLAGIAADASSATPAPKTFLVDLSTALAVAGARSVEVRFAEAKEDEQRQAIYGAWEMLVPNVDPGILLRAHRGNVQRATGQFLDVTKQAEWGGAAATAEWDPGTVIFRALSAARRTDAAHFSTETQRDENALAVAETYYELVRTRALVRIADQALQDARALEKDEEAWVGRGKKVKVELLRAQALVSQKELAFTQAEGQVAATSAKLAEILQLQPGVELVPFEDMPVPTVRVSTEVPLEQLLDWAERGRPELKESENLISAAEHDREGVLWGPLVPQADAGVSTGILGGTFGASASSHDYVAGAGWKIGPGGLLDIPAINAASDRLKQARIRDEGLRARIAREVVTARADTITADREVVSARNGVVAAEEALRLSNLRYARGAAIELEVLDAQATVTTARTAEVQAIVDLNRAQYRLLRAIGGPVENAPR
jgi:outer membrane protein TolC